MSVCVRRYPPLLGWCPDQTERTIVGYSTHFTLSYGTVAKCYQNIRAGLKRAHFFDFAGAGLGLFASLTANSCAAWSIVMSWAVWTLASPCSRVAWLVASP